MVHRWMICELLSVGLDQDDLVVIIKNIFLKENLEQTFGGNKATKLQGFHTKTQPSLSHRRRNDQ